MSALVTIPPDADAGRLSNGFHDNLDQLITLDRWTTILTDSGSVAVRDAAGGGVAIIPSDGTEADNDEAYMHTTQEAFLFADDKPIVFEADVQFTEANTDDANILVGLMSGAAANHLLDNGAGPAASYSGAVFFKVDGSTNWQVENSISTTQKTTDLTAANSLDGELKTAGGASFQRLRIEVNPITSSKMDISFWIDDVLVAKHKDQAMGSATEMAVIIGAKNGDTNTETLNVRRVMCYQTY